MLEILNANYWIENIVNCVLQDDYIFIQGQNRILKEQAKW